MADRTRASEELESPEWTKRVAALRALKGELSEEIKPSLVKLAADPKWEVRRELALLLADPTVDAELASSLLATLQADHTRWVRETAARAAKQRSAVEKKKLTAIPPEPHLAYVAERVAELGSRSIKPNLVLDLVAQGGEYFYRALAAETAHEVRTLLTPIVGYFEKLVQHLESNAALDDKSSAYTRTIAQRLDQLRTLIDQITIYAGQEQIEYAAIDLREIARDAVQIAIEKCASQAEVRYEMPDALIAEVGAARLRQALVNVATNALEAMPQGGTLAIAGENGAGVVRLSLADTGPGLTAEQVESAFLRFRTTKRARGGTGLGLPIAKRIVEDEHGGTLVMTSIVGAGTRVEIAIPSEREAKDGE